jgi:hypothetical protein
MAVDVEQALAILALEDDVSAPDLVEQGRMTAVGGLTDDRLLSPAKPERRWMGWRWILAIRPGLTNAHISWLICEKRRPGRHDGGKATCPL